MINASYGAGYRAGRSESGFYNIPDCPFKKQSVKRLLWFVGYNNGALDYTPYPSKKGNVNVC